MRKTFIPTRDFGLEEQSDAQLVLDLMDRLEDDPSFCPIITVRDGAPIAPSNAPHLLTAAYWLGWKLYPADVFEDNARVETGAGSR